MDDLVKRVDALSVKPPKISKETHLLTWLRDVKRGVHPNEARGKSGTAQYQALMNVRKREECPYTDEEPELKEAWERFTTLFPLERPEDVYYLQRFGEKYRDTGDFDAACGNTNTNKFAALKNIVDKDLRFPAFQAYEEQLKSGWKYETKRFTEMTPNLHLLEFFEEYREHNDFKKARGVNNTTRYKVLVLITKKADEECSELERELKALWKGNMTSQEHLEAFFEEYREHNDFKKARGVSDTATYAALLRTNTTTADPNYYLKRTQTRCRAKNRRAVVIRRCARRLRRSRTLRGAYGRGRTAEGLYERFLHHVHLGDINETSNVRSEQVPLCFPVTNR